MRGHPPPRSISKQCTERVVCSRYALNKSPSFMEMGEVKWDLALCLLAAWIIVAAALIKGIKTSGKVVYFTATFPYVILVILFIQGLTLEGASMGLKYYLQPDFSRLSSIQVWKDAAIQVFYSFSIAGGGMITYASYNKFSNNLIRDVLIIGIGDMLTSIFSGLVVFSMLGYMAVQLGKPISEVVESRTGLAFIVYPQGISMMPVPILWALLFFFMLFLLGIDSQVGGVYRGRVSGILTAGLVQFAMVETLITFIFDQFPSTRSRKPLVVAGISAVLFLLGLPLACRRWMFQGGVYLLDILDNYAAGWPYLFIGTLECLVIAYFYGEYIGGSDTYSKH
ncbi:hypothetical protein LAZ67_18001836 [Cordylochernes scorpioides]|uniref:Sodium-dependent nutrient amino acid transporter 1 n=1 Tax=Cordylochernes scorpioides TaxID=51811 RepID=A0ABY6LH12_9ARAC|nr:hypothetical protein LAZ67_18001836 [Cordylochernes scorpioides]